MFAQKPRREAGAFSAQASEFLRYAEVELRFAKETITKYRDCLSQVARSCGERPVSAFSKSDLFSLKAQFLSRKLSVARQVSILLALKRFFRYLRDEKGLAVFDPECILIPRRERKEVAYLTAEEVARFVATIKVRSKDDAYYLSGLRFRTLVEVLLGSGMRISEVLSLDRNQVDFEQAEARIVGKGRKERVVFFTDRALYWIKTYLAARSDRQPPLFVCQDGVSRVKRPDVWRFFVRHTKLAGLAKRVTPHLLRHTAATQLLFNGCPISHIKEVLGHERLETTCRYYLGLDHRAAKRAHRQFLTYS